MQFCIRISCRLYTRDTGNCPFYLLMEVAQDHEVFLRYLKLAVAVAVIRSRPSGLSGRQYAQYLYGQYQKSQLAWKEKTKSLEQELLHMQQKALYCQLTRINQPNSTSGDDFPTPPSSAEAVWYRTSDSDSPASVNLNDHRTTLSKYTSFLQSILTLDSLSDQGISDNAEIAAGNIHTIKCSLDLLTDFLVEQMNNRSDLCGGINLEVGFHAVNVVSRLADVWTGSSRTVETVHKLILRSTQRFIAAIVDNNNLNKFASQYQICQYILTLSKALVLREGILWLLLQQVTSCGEMLRDSISKNVILEPQKMENIYFMFWCIEQLLCSDSVRAGGVSETFCREFALLLSQSLLHISQDFPVFAHYVWHIGELLESIQKK